MRFVSLHHHSTFSYGDGFGTPASHVARAAELGMSAMALTEHGNVSSHAQLEKAANKAGIKPIFGLEAYTALDAQERRKFHLTILASNEVGYRNLMEIVGQSWRDFYHWPTVSGQLLADHAEGLIVLSGCADSLLACSMLGGKSIDPADASWKRAKRTAEAFKDLLGDRFYLETQMFPELDRTKAINPAYERMGAKLGIPLVATQDVHYPHPDDNEMQVILHAATRGTGSVAQQEAGWEYNIRLTHPVSDKVALKRLRGTGLSKLASSGALEATAEIAERCSVVLPKADRLRFPLGKGQSRLELIWQWLRDGWTYRVRHGNRRMAERKEEYLARLKYEMELIEAKDFLDYFLMTSDIVRYAKDNGVAVGPARGSAASSLVCYLLRITEIDPLQYPLMYFERFIALDRVDIPDIDLDFDSDKRPEVRAYAVRKYGEERVGNIANYVRYKGKNSLADVGRVYPHIPYGEIEEVKALIIERSGGDSRADAALADTISTFPRAADIVARYPDLMKATRLEGNYRSMSVHAAGLVIAERPIADTCALYTRESGPAGRKTSTTVVSVDKKDAEYLGLMKMDLLGLSTMSLIRSVLEDCGLTLDDLYAIQMDDHETLQAFRDTDVVGIFQFEGRATRLVCKDVKPDNFLELADINGLSRPGPLFSGTTADYINVKWGRKKREAIHPLWDQITDFTKGQVIYQEQVLKALAEIGNLPVHRVHEIRKIISQKLGEAQFNASAEDFVTGAKELHGIDRKTAEFMWGRLVTSATYSFNIAHCISYSMLAFWCMWLKVHYPAQFYAGALRYTDKKADNFTRIVRDALRHNVSVRGPGVGSAVDWKAIAHERAIQAGWKHMPGIAEAKAEAIMHYMTVTRPALGLPEEMDPEDLINVPGIGPAMMAKLREVNPSDPFGLRKIGEQLTVVRSAIRAGEVSCPTPRHTSDQIMDMRPGQKVFFLGLVKHKQYKDFIEDERARTGDSIDAIKARMRQPDLVTSCTLQCFDEGEEDVYIRFSRFQYPKFKQALERLRVGHDMVMVVANKPPRNSFGINIVAERLWIVDPD